MTLLDSYYSILSQGWSFDAAKLERTAQAMRSA
jgi:hypothetical protein